MKKFNSIVIQTKYNSGIIFENLTPQEMGQLSHLLSKSHLVMEKYERGTSFWERKEEPDGVSIVSPDKVSNPTTPAAGPENAEG